MSRLPLYKGVDLEHKRENPNAGLLFERFYDQYNADASEFLASKSVNGKPAQGNNFWLQKFKSAGDTNALQDAALRQMDLAKQLKGKHKFFNTQWHFVTGTGYPHPVENGLLWHPVHGVPYLSGAAVKGLVRAWVEEWEFAAPDGESEDEKNARLAKKRKRLLDWFGSDHKDAKDQQYPVQTGNVIFFDALPVKAVTLVTDIMTPHQGKWYSDGRNIKDVANEPEKVPADWHDPVPIPFLVVDKATSYLFSVVPRNALAAERVNMVDVIECLTQALEWLGAGAKTATGYGGFNNYPGIHPIEKQWLTVTQTLDEKLIAMTEKQLIAAFSTDYNATKTRFEEEGFQWQEIIARIWQHHETTISNWAESKDKNPKKAFKKLSEYNKQS